VHSSLQVTPNTLDRLLKGESGPEGRRLTRVGALNPVSANKPTSTGSVDVMHVCGFSNSIGIERGAVDPALRRPRHLAPMQRAVGLREGDRHPPAALGHLHDRSTAPDHC